MLVKNIRILALSAFCFLLGSISVAALEVTTREYDNNNGDIYETVDGLIFKKTGYGYVGYIGYHEEIIFLSEEEVCLDGEKYEIEIFEYGSSDHYSISTYDGADAYAKVEEICGEIQ